MLGLWWIGCKISVPNEPPPIHEEPEPPPAPTARDPFLLEEALDQVGGVSMRYSGSRLLAAWSADGRAWADWIDPLDPAVDPVELGFAGADAPVLGEAQQRTIFAWDDGAGGISIRGVYESGDLFEPLWFSTDLGANVGLGLASDGSGFVAYSEADAIEMRSFDRELTDLSTPFSLPALRPDTLVTTPAGDGTLRAVWWDPPEDSPPAMVSALLHGIVEDAVPVDTPEAVLTSGPNPAVAAREDGRFAIAWGGKHDLEDTLYLRTFGPDGAPQSDPVRVASGLPAEITLVWVGEELAVAWTSDDDPPRVQLAVVTPDGTPRPGTPTAVGSVWDRLLHPTLAAREVNGGHEIALAWSRDEIELWVQPFFLGEAAE